MAYETRRAMRGLATAAALTAGLGIGGASAQQAAAPAAAPAADSPWLKVCNADPANNQQICVVTQELRADNGTFIASATLRQQQGQSGISMIVAVPPGVLLQPGLATKVDNNAQVDIKYEICFPNACYARLDTNMDYVNQLKRGNQLAVQAINQTGQPLTFPFSLAGFTRTFDGEGMNAEAAQVRQDELNAALQQRAEEARQRLIEQQRAAAAGAVAPR